MVRLFGRNKKQEAEYQQHSVTPPVEVLAPRGATMADDGSVHLNISSAAEARAAIKQMRIVKREINVEKKLINAELAALRANRRAQVAQHGSKMRGGGNLGKSVRAFQMMGRDTERRKYSNALEPYEQAKRSLDLKLANCDLAIAKLEQHILDQMAD